MTNEPATIVIVGASGDLTHRLLFPALHRLMALGRVSPKTKIVGYAMDDWTTETFVEHLRQGVEEFGDGVDDTAWASIVPNTTYVCGTLDVEHVQALDPLVSGPAIFYLALPPTLFGTAAKAIGSAGFSDESAGWRRLVIEKPFGTDVASAAALQSQLRAHWNEDQLFSIDHFLGKDTVQNMLVFRLANRLIESVWNVHNVGQVQITAAETLGLEGRWRYYDEAGALRDMLQNHLMQLFALTAMEAPSVWEAEILREHKVEVLRSVTAITAEDVDRVAVRGQYGPGTIDGAPVPGYTDEANIPADSTTETYAALCLRIDNWRWQGVPFYLRSGKRMAGGITEIALELRPPPSRMFGSSATDGEEQDSNWIVLRLRPDETIEIHALAKKAGLGMATERISLSATDDAVAGPSYTAYEQLLLDAIAGDRSLFIRGDEAAEAWRIVQPVLDRWADSGRPATYAAGTDGPPAPPGFFEFDRRWRTVTP
jgi:glucose-6-phosphate 1-dehydrogenase